jgi:hypothetical protein
MIMAIYNNNNNNNNIQNKLRGLWSASELCQPNGRRLSAKLVAISAGGGMGSRGQRNEFIRPLISVL